ncbi:ISAs1 family transposase [Pseudonocardia sp. GCM10023141]|uniref:ISAs1 family transposase n=1 Tax=Pseudonocardia sp. GCM10023141 TaxID=3252653 RepID=UPI00360C1757
MPAPASSPIPAAFAQLATLQLPDPVAALPGLLDVLAAVIDPWARRGVRHRLVTILAVSICAVTAGALSLVAIAEWADDLPVDVANALDLRRRPPCESTIRRVLARVDGDGLDLVLSTWIAARLDAEHPRRAVAVDGKTVRGAHTPSGDGEPPGPARHLLAAIDHDARVVVGQVAVDGKTSEIARFAPLLDSLDLREVVVTADALHTQRGHVDYLHARGAHWVLTVKGNQPTLRRQLASMPWRAVQVGHRSTERGHGRREIRTLKVVTIAAGIMFPHAAQAIQLVRRRRQLTSGTWHTETVYAITDLRPHQARPEQLANWIRGHWQIENSLHWVRDVTYAEDLSQVRTGHAPQVMASLPVN